MRKDDSKSKQEESVEDMPAEILRLQRQFRLLEDDRRTYREESKYSLRKQNEAIQTLNEEHEELFKEQKLAGSKKNKSNDAHNTESLNSLLEEEVNTLTEFQQRKDKLVQLNKDINCLLTATDQLRKRIGGCEESETKTKATDKLNRVMENRLNEANVRFNVALANNKKMRQEIHHINKQRNRFQDLQRKLTKRFVVGKKKKAFLIESSTAQFHNRDEAHHRMQSLRERSERDMTQFNSELKDIQRVLDHDKKLQEFMNTKMEERSELYEATVQGRLEKKMRNNLKVLDAEVQHYETIFEQLIEVSKTEDISEMVKNFIAIEDENFSMFNFVKEQTQSIQLKENSIVDLKKEIDVLRALDNSMLDKQQDRLKTLQEVTATEETELEAFKERLANDQEQLEQLTAAIESLLTNIECNRAEMNDLLGGSKITQDNVIAYLGLIEQKAIGLLQARMLLSFKDGDSVDVVGVARKQMKFKTLSRLAWRLVVPPNVVTEIPDIGSSVGNDSIRPLSQKEVRHIAVGMAKMAGNSNQKLSH